MNVRKTSSLIFAICLLACATARAQEAGKDVHVAPNAPKDAPISVAGEEARKFEQALQPHIEKAKKSYPEAKKRFLAGLPAKHSFFVTTRLTDDEGRFEQVFIAVREIKDGFIKGRVWSDVRLITRYQHGDVYSFPESELLDWTISKPDGTEEGNFVGKFIDSLNQIPPQE